MAVMRYLTELATLRAYRSVNVDWVMKDNLLNAIEIKGNHTGENIGKHLLEIIEINAIRDKNVCITTDNATNNTTMALYLE